MSWVGWVIVLVTLISLYLLGLVIYRLVLNAKALKAEIDQAQRLIAAAQDFEELAIEPATASTQQQLGKLLANRRSFVRAREKKAEDEQRRLVERVRDIETDKR